MLVRRQISIHFAARLSRLTTQKAKAHRACHDGMLTQFADFISAARQVHPHGSECGTERVRWKWKRGESVVSEESLMPSEKKKNEWTLIHSSICQNVFWKARSNIARYKTEKSRQLS